MNEKLKLYRAHSLKYLKAQAGIIENLNLARTRRARDSRAELHATSGLWFESKFGVNYRANSLFCTGSLDIARGYMTEGKALIELAPIGPFSLCYSERCKDLFGHFQFKTEDFFQHREKIIDELDSLEFVHFENRGIAESSASSNEVMVIAEKFAYRRLA